MVQYCAVLTGKVRKLAEKMFVYVYLTAQLIEGKKRMWTAEMSDIISTLIFDCGFQVTVELETIKEKTYH